MVWPTPSGLAWPENWQTQVKWDPTNDPTVEYARVWSVLEHDAVSQLVTDGQPWTSSQLGRGHTVAPQKKQIPHVPLKSSRAGELTPDFLGVSLRHNHWFRQARRLQSLVRCLSAPEGSPQRVQNIQGTWNRIVQAPGFVGGFVQWWSEQQLHPEVSDTWHRQCPDHDVCQAMYQTFQVQLRNFERKLNKVRCTQAKVKRGEDRNLVFQDCKGDAPLPIDALYDRREVSVQEVLPEEQAIVLDEPFAFRPDIPMIIQGRPVEVIAHDTDKLWVADVGSAKEGDVAVQEARFTSEDEIIAQLEQLWKPRWQKLSHVENGQWTQITAFCEQVVRPMTWEFPDLTTDLVRLSTQKKKKRSATGSDGVSRSDVLALPNRRSSNLRRHASGYRTRCSMAETTHCWLCEFVG